MVRLPDKGNGNRQGQNPDGDSPDLAALSQTVKDLVALISPTDISDLHVESGQVRIVIKRGGQALVAQAKPTSVYTPPATLPGPDASSPVNLIGHSPAHGGGIALTEGEELIVAPMVGTFYAAPAPNEPPFVTEGDTVEPGQPVGIIEAMKMMNKIESDWTGVITRILVQNAQPVEYGQPLMIVQTV